MTSLSARLPSLDGLRGLAAIVVVVHHALLTWPALFAQYEVPNRGSGTWWLTFTPLHLAWAGREAVVVFFILSGLVLVLPFLGPRKVGTWPGYLVRRVLRLYPPVAVALVLSAVLVAASRGTQCPERRLVHVARRRSHVDRLRARSGPDRRHQHDQQRPVVTAVRGRLLPAVAARRPGRASDAAAPCVHPADVASFSWHSARSAVPTGRVALRLPGGRRVGDGKEDMWRLAQWIEHSASPRATGPS